MWIIFSYNIGLKMIEYFFLKIALDKTTFFILFIFFF